jgi:hypothetical protein
MPDHAKVSGGSMALPHRHVVRDRTGRRVLRIGAFATLLLGSVTLCAELPENPVPQSSSTSEPAQAALKSRIEPAGAQSRVAIVNHRPYVPPTQHDLWHDYWQDTYGLGGWARTGIRAVYSQARGKPEGWGQDWPGFGQRFGSSAAVTSINGTVKLGMEELFHEDLRYIPCHGCSAKHKIENALLAEITARHETDGHRVFSLTPTIADFSGPIIVHASWYPGASATPIDGVISARLVFATRIGTHLAREFLLERRHKDEHE